ncbi:MAG: hypothetical protein QM726_20515 [Chitinophagaceae bacterium]
MKFLPLIATIITVIVLLSKRYAQSKRNKKMQELRKKWGKPNNGYYNFERIESYYRYQQSNNFHTISNQVKADIDFNDLFSFLDHTNSKPGQQFLFNALSRPGNNLQALQQLNKQADFFTAEASTREEIQLLLTDLNDDNAYHIASLLFGELPEKPSWFRLVIVDIVLTITLIVLSFFFKVLLLWLMLPLAVNMALHYWNRNNIYYFAASLPQLNRLINVSKLLTQKDIPFEKQEIANSIIALKKFQRTMRMLGLRQSSLGSDVEQIAYYAIDIIKAFFLVELFAFYSLVKDLKAKQKAIAILFDYVGSVDTALSIASLRACGLQTCLPEFKEAGKQLLAKEVYHPLIEDCVTNNLSIDTKSILITGSNMSGKSTFLRTIAINSLLAQTIYTCFAQTYQSPFVKLFSSIRIDDNLQEGKSYYFAEVNIMGELVKEAGSQWQNLFILDEVFKGTNTIERIASAKAILSYLNKGNNIVLVATHDIELSAMLQSAYDLYHFEETIVDNQLQFDHQLKQGQLTSRNAIKILEIAGYPSIIIDEANNISNQLSKETVNKNS